MCDSSDSEGSFEELMEVNLISCLFTEKQFPSAEAYFIHLKTNCNFDIWNLVHVELKLDFFGYVKLINFLRANYKGKEVPTTKDLQDKKEIWQNESYLKPTLENDPLLQFIIDDEIDDEPFSANSQSLINPGSGEHASSSLTAAQISQLVVENKRLKEDLERMQDHILKMKKVMQDIVIQGGSIYRPVSACRKPFDREEEDEEFEDSGYFRSYDHFDIHREMLQDQTRTLAYRDAMLKNSSVFKDKVVLDVGCGTGILSMFAAQAGAKQVFAVERSDIAASAIDNILKNGLGNKIQVLRTNVEEIKLPVQHVDIIISEWMGYFLLYESMLDSVLDAASKWLAPDGIILPNKCQILLAAAEATAYKRSVCYWDDVYGFQMPCMKTAVLNEATVTTIPSNEIISASVSVFALDIVKSTKQNQLDFKSEFKLLISRDSKLDTIVGYFDVDFNLPEETIVLSTEPVENGSCKNTHWKQTLFFLPQPIDVKKGQQVCGSIECHKNPVDPRSLLVELTVDGMKHQYQIS